MRRAARLVLGLCQVGLCASSVTACIGIESQVRGVVHYARTAGCSDVPPGTAASDVTVKLECPGSEPLVAVTPMGGRFRFDADGPLAGGCVVSVEKEGYRPRRYTMAEVCVDAVPAGASCEAAAVTAYVVPIAPPEDEASEDEASEGEASEGEASAGDGTAEDAP